MIFSPVLRLALILALSASVRLLANSPDAVVTFNEIHYNPVITQDAEWIELHNQMAVRIDLSGWSLADGVSYTFPKGTVIPGGGHLVVAKTPGHPSLAGVTGVLGPFSGSLSNSGETIDLLSSSGRLMDRLEYSDRGEWPIPADGLGATLAKRAGGAPTTAAASWRASAQPGGTPGAANFPATDLPIQHPITSSQSSWRFRHASEPPPPDWASLSFDDASWSLGQGPIGTASSPEFLSVTGSLTSRYRAGAVTGVINGSTFSPWRDEASGDGTSQNTVRVSDPQFILNATPSGQPVVRFDGNDGFAASALPGIGPTSGFVYFIVCKANGAPANGAMGAGDGAYLFDRVPTVDSPLVSLKAINGRYGLQLRYDNGSGLGGPVSVTPIATDRFQIVAVRRNPAAARFEVWVDGVMEASHSDSGANLTPQPIVIGKHGSASNGFVGDIAELLIYQDPLDAESMQSVGSYLQARYGLETAYPDSSVVTTLPGTAPTTYFRNTFEFTGDPQRTQLMLHHTLADGGVFYLNGQEISRTNMPDGVVSHTTPALSSLDPPATSPTFVIPSEALRRGMNVISASVHTAGEDPNVYFSATVSGTEAPPDPGLLPALVLNEIAGTGSPDFFIELLNPNEVPVSTEGSFLTRQGSAVTELPVLMIPAGGLLHLDEPELGFRPLAGEKITINGPGGALLDVQLADTILRGRSRDWPGRWLFPASATPGEPNHFTLVEDVVINEICYNPVSLTPASPAKEWVELYNRGSIPVDLGGWRFSAGINYTFPSGTILEPEAYLVLAKNPGSFPVAAGAAVLGPFGGNLSNSGELLRLIDAFGNPADEVDYLDGGRWPGKADGAGTSMELRDTRADNSLPEAWEASDESERRAWKSYSYQATATRSSVGPDNQWRDFVLGLLDGGDVMIDDLSVIESPDTAPVQMIANGNFQNGANGWRFLGNHRNSRIVPDPDDPANHVLLISATGGTEHMHNHIETTLANGRQVVDGRVYQISYRARWLNGSNNLNTRLYFNRVAKTTPLDRIDIHGTPGERNSTAVSNAGPGFTFFSHSPAVPASGVPVTVTARAADPDGLGLFNLHYSVNGGAFNSVPMTSTSLIGEFTASIPGQSAASVVRFYVQANDAAEPPATSFFPKAGAGSHALFQVDDGLAATNGLHNIRIIMTPEDKALLYRTNNLMSNGRLGCTVIYNEREIYYDVGVRLKSSQRGRPSDARVGFNLGFKKDQLFRGIHRTIAIDRSEGANTGCREILFDHMMYASGGVPAEFNDLCRVIAPNPAHTSQAILQLARFGNVFLDSQFEDGSDGTVFEYELIYYPTTADAAGYKLPQPDSVVGIDISDMGNDKEAYRWAYLQKNNEDLDNYTPIMAMAKHFSKSGSAFNEGLDDIIDVDQWLRALAYSCATGAGDTFFDNSNHNGQFYARPDGRVLYFPHDMDFAFSANRNIFSNNELNKIRAVPARHRAYLGHLHDICTTVYNTGYMSSWSSHYGGFLPGEDFPGHLAYINSRSNYILNAINSSVAAVSFEITTNGGADFSTVSSPVTLTGRGWVDVRSIRLAGGNLPLEVVWTSNNTWTAKVPLQRGANPLSLEAIDFSGGVVGSDSITVTNTGDVSLPETRTLVVSKIYYNPPGSQGSEYVELMNTGTVELDLSYVAFTAGITFTFPAGTRLLPGGRILVVKDPDEFSAIFGSGPQVAGSYPNNLSNSGERLELTRADGIVIHSFVYSDQPPWPAEADGEGYALVLVDPGSNPDHGDPLSWRASHGLGGAPGAPDAQGYAEWRLLNGEHDDDEDRDGDGINTLLEYYLGGNPQLPEPDLMPKMTISADGSWLMSITRRVGLDVAGPLVESSSDLAEWLPDPAAELLETLRIPGFPTRDRLTFRVDRVPAEAAYFVRFAFGR